LWAFPATGGTVGVPAREARTYRGLIEATAVGGPLRLVNQLDVETYLKGMAEVRDASWPPAALRVQAIAARTYALRAMKIAGEICDTQRCQVYVGAAAEYGAMNAAVDQTRGQVLTYEGRLISSVYSSNAGGNSASPEEGFGTVNAGAPYLQPGPYLTHDPKPWRVEVALTDVAVEPPPAPPPRTVLQRPPGFTPEAAPATVADEAPARLGTDTRVITSGWPGGRIAPRQARATPPGPSTDLSGVVAYASIVLGLAVAAAVAKARKSREG